MRPLFALRHINLVAIIPVIRGAVKGKLLCFFWPMMLIKIVWPQLALRGALVVNGYGGAPGRAGGGGTRRASL